MRTYTLQGAVDDLYDKTQLKKKATSTERLRGLAEFCVQELAVRGLPGAELDPGVPGFARVKDWDVVWTHDAKVRLALSLKSLLENPAGAVPNRVDDLMGEVANLQLHSPEVVIGYMMIFNVAEDRYSKKHGGTWSETLRKRLLSISGRKAPHWTVGTVEAVAFVEVDFRAGPKIVSGSETVSAMFNALTAQVTARNPSIDVVEK